VQVSAAGGHEHGGHQRGDGVDESSSSATRCVLTPASATDDEPCASAALCHRHSSSSSTRRPRKHYKIAHTNLEIGRVANPGSRSTHSHCTQSVDRICQMALICMPIYTITWFSLPTTSNSIWVSSVSSTGKNRPFMLYVAGRRRSVLKTTSLQLHKISAKLSSLYDDDNFVNGAACRNVVIEQPLHFC